MAQTPSLTLPLRAVHVDRCVVGCGAAPTGKSSSAPSSLFPCFQYTHTRRLTGGHGTRNVRVRVRGAENNAAYVKMGVCVAGVCEGARRGACQHHPPKWWHEGAAPTSPGVAAPSAGCTGMPTAPARRSPAQVTHNRATPHPRRKRRVSGWGCTAQRWGAPIRSALICLVCETRRIEVTQRSGAADYALSKNTRK